MLNIRKVECFLLSCALPEPLVLPYFGGERRILKRDAMLIRVEADKGLIGYAPGPATEKAKRLIDTVVAPFLRGRTLADPDALRVQFIEGPGRDWAVQKVYCAVEIALFDLVGKAKELPVSELIGGRLRDRIRVYGSAGMYTTPTRYAEEAHAISQLGFRAYKMRAGIGPEDDLTTVRLMRAAVGPDFDLMVDAHTWWRMGDKNYVFGTIDHLAEEFARYHVAWLEEPLPPEDHEGYLRLKELDFVPIAAGEHEPTEHSFMDLIFTESVDYVQMDVVSQGGFPTARRLLAEIAHAGLRFAFHSWGTALELIVAAQLGICWPDMVVEWLEYPCYSTPSRAGMYPFPLAAEILKNEVEIAEGDLIVPAGPGLGVAVDERVIERYPWIPGPWSTWAFAGEERIRELFSDPSEKWPVTDKAEK
jgi:L-alanine-DL-glutamate epimerase-like enolase superfamily enzyme